MEELNKKKNTGSYTAIKGFSQGLSDLVSQMLQLDPTKRPTVDEILNSPFAREYVVKIREALTANDDCGSSIHQPSSDGGGRSTHNNYSSGTVASAGMVELQDYDDDAMS